MSFSFTTQDEINKLHPSIADYFPTFLQHRIDAFKELEVFVTERNFEKIRDYCHKQIGVAANYKCFKLDEVTRYIQEFAREEKIQEIEDSLQVFNDYLVELEKVYLNSK